MERQEVLEFLGVQLKKLKEEHVADLMKANRVEELKEVANEMEFGPLNAFIEENGYLELEFFEIPKGYHYELAFYISQSECVDNDIFEDFDDFIELLEETQEELAEKIATTMAGHSLCDCSIEELLSGKLEEE